MSKKTPERKAKQKVRSAQNKIRKAEKFKKLQAKNLIGAEERKAKRLGRKKLSPNYINKNIKTI